MSDDAKVKSVARPAEPVNDLVVIARNPQQMMAAQANLTGWAAAKLAAAQEELTDFETNLETARKNKWKVTVLQRAVSRAHKRVVFYDKILQVLRAGYVIVPNMPVDVFAIRTTRRNPDRNAVYQEDTIHRAHELRDPSPQQTNAPPAGEGRYVKPEAMIDVIEARLPPKPGEHSSHYDVQKWAATFDDEIEFPFQLAAPIILNATTEALALKLFDDVGVSPSRDRANLVTRGPDVKGDPMVIGRVIFRDGFNSKAVSFLVTWFVDTRELP